MPEPEFIEDQIKIIQRYQADEARHLEEIRQLRDLLGQCYRRMRFVGMDRRSCVLQKIDYVLGGRAEEDYQNIVESVRLV